MKQVIITLIGICAVIAVLFAGIANAEVGKWDAKGKWYHASENLPHGSTYISKVYEGNIVKVKTMYGSNSTKIDEIAMWKVYCGKHQYQVLMYTSHHTDDTFSKSAGEGPIVDVPENTNDTDAVVYKLVCDEKP